MKQVVLLLAVITCSESAFCERGDNGDRMEMMRNMAIRSELKSINKSHNPGANKAVYDQMIEDLAREGRSYNHDSLRSMTAFLARAPDATCSFGKRASGTQVPQYTKAESNYGINCISPSKGKKGRMFFSGLPSAVINSLASQQSHHVPDALMNSYINANNRALAAQSNDSAANQTAFEPARAVNPSPAFNPNALVDNPSSSATPVTGTAN